MGGVRQGTQLLLSEIFFKFCYSGAVTQDLEHINRLSALSHTLGHLDLLKHRLNLPSLIHLHLQPPPPAGVGVGEENKNKLAFGGARL